MIPDSFGDEAEVVYPEPRRSLCELGTVNLVPQSALYQPVRSVGLVPIRHVVVPTLTVRVARLCRHLHLLGLGLILELLHLQGLTPNLEQHLLLQGDRTWLELRTSQVSQLLRHHRLLLTHIVSQDLSC